MRCTAPLLEATTLLSLELRRRLFEARGLVVRLSDQPALVVQSFGGA